MRCICCAGCAASHANTAADGDKEGSMCGTLSELTGSGGKQTHPKAQDPGTIDNFQTNFHPAQKTPTQDEKNMRWALNKFFYTQRKNSLQTAYTLMLKEKYCNSSGLLLPDYPTIHQFRYFYRKHKNMQKFYISRDGLSDYQRNSRPLTGNGIQEFASSVGVGMLDSTICDIYLVNESGGLV